MKASSGCLLGKESVWANLTSVSLERSYKLVRLDQDEVQALQTVYQTLYPTVTQLSLSSLYKKYMALTVCGERYGSMTGSRLICPHICFMVR